MKQAVFLMASIWLCGAHFTTGAQTTRMEGKLVQGMPVQAQPAAQAAADISGKWHFTLNTDGGDREQNALFKVAADQVTGKWDTADVKGTYKEGDLDLAFPFTSDEAGMTATFKVKGKLKDGKLVGTWEFGDYSGTLTGTRGN